MSRPSKTFLIEAGANHFRVDLRKTANGYEVMQVLRPEVTDGQPGGSAEDFPSFDPFGGAAMDTEWIAPLLQLKPKPAAEITVLSDQVTAVIAEMPGTPGEDWRSSAEMEAQTISGLSSSEAIASTTRLPAEAGMVRCWTVQASMRDVGGMRKAIAESSKSRLVAVGNPAGIRLDPTAPQLESWNEFALFHAPGEKIDLRGWNGPDAFVEANEDGEVVAALLEAGEGARLLVAAPVELDAPETPVFEPDDDVVETGPPPLADSLSGEGSTTPTGLATSIDLSSIAGAERWSAGLARSCDPLTGNLLGLPTVAVPKPPPTPQALATAAIGLGVLTALLLAGHYFLNQQRKEALEANLTQINSPAQRVVEANKRITELEKELKELAAKASAGDGEVNVYAHRRRIGALLDGIAAGATVSGAIVLDVKPDKLDTVLSGAATTFNAPQELAGSIDAALASSGWRAALVRRTAKLLRPDGGPWSYEIRLSPGRPVSVDESAPADDRSGENQGTSASVTF